jgi:hypothetical protein
MNGFWNILGGKSSVGLQRDGVLFVGEGEHKGNDGRLQQGLSSSDAHIPPAEFAYGIENVCKRIRRSFRKAKRAITPSAAQWASSKSHKRCHTAGKACFSLDA